MKRQRMTMAQALEISGQSVCRMDGVETICGGSFTIFGHGIVLGLGQALDENPGGLKVHQGRNEQGMAHVATGFAKQHITDERLSPAHPLSTRRGEYGNRGAATATVNISPLLLLPGRCLCNRAAGPGAAAD
jgi:3D-(3,5/4)-trihydroxycyclohexane-1,2-dione acylhydrolase (decyclizing)